MLVLCAWCQAEGVENVINRIEGPEDQVSHGICNKHQEEMLAQIGKIKKVRYGENSKRRRRR